MTNFLRDQKNYCQFVAYKGILANNIQQHNRSLLKYWIRSQKRELLNTLNKIQCIGFFQIHTLCIASF
jgi:hypothetical protein